MILSIRQAIDAGLPGYEDNWLFYSTIFTSFSRFRDLLVNASLIGQKQMRGTGEGLG